MIALRRFRFWSAMLSTLAMMLYAGEAYAMCYFCSDPDGPGPLMAECYLSGDPRQGYHECTPTGNGCILSSPCWLYGPGNITADGSVTKAPPGPVARIRFSRMLGFSLGAPSLMLSDVSAVMTTCKGYVIAREYSPRLAQELRNATMTIEI